MATTSKSIGTPFGISTPPLLKYLQSILRGYSDGQILKELLQNAEDAGATQVQFIYDKNQYGTDFLVNERLQDFQGPALCSYNNAIFTDDDWKAIQTPAQSGKKNNALKVGRFGIGFNSVYHITDLPCILSEQYMAMIDPFERWFETEDGLRSSGCKWCLRDVLSNKCEVDQLQPIKQSFPEGVKFDEKGCLPGTMFRFPLRKSASKLCESVYTPEKTMELLDAFRDDAQIVLLFLRNIERVQIFCREVESSKPKLYLEVHFEKSELSNLRSVREKFCSILQQAKETSNYESNISMQTDFNVITRSEGITITERWVVHQEIMFQCSNKLQTLFQKLKFLPWVGVAIPMFEQDISVGRTFCFFPLPSGEESRSGLPVHVHGFFGVSDDRRSLKWPGGDQIQNEEAIWNKLLADEVLPKVYAKALLRATQVSVDYHIDPNIVYTAFPDARQNLGYWSNAVSKLYRDLFTQPMLYCNCKGKWMTYDDVYILPDGLKEPNAQQKVVIKCLQLSGYDVIATLPDHVEHALIEKFSGQAQFVSSKLVLSCLTRETLDQCDSQERMSLLAYLLDDDCDAKSLNGLPLLPTKAGHFVQFIQYPASHEVIYIETDECPQRLLPNTEDRFLATICDEEFTNLREKLEEMGLSDTWMQLQILTVQKLVELLPETLPRTWTFDDDTPEEWFPSSENQPDLKWLQEVWQFVWSKEVNLCDLHGLKLIPVTDLDTEPIKLMGLMVPSKLIEYPSCNQIPFTISEMENVFVAIGITVCKIPDFVSRYHQFRELFYVHSLTPNGILKVLQVIGQEVIESACASDDILQSQFVSNIMPFLSGSLFSEAEVRFLKRLHIFVDHGHRSSNKLISLDDNPLIVNDETLDKTPNINLCKSCIHVHSDDMAHLLQKLGLQPAPFDVVLKLYLKNAEANKYCENEVKKLLEWVKPQYETLRVISDVRNLLGNIRFVPSQMNSLKKPIEVFDTSDRVIKLLIHDIDLLPNEDFLEIWLHILKELGIMNRKHVQVGHLRLAAQCIEETRDRERALALWNYLSDRPYCLYTDGDLCKTLQTVPFLHSRTEPPTSYPQNVPFYKSTSLFKPCEVITYSEVNCQLVGAILPLLEVDAIKDPKVVSLLGIRENPRVIDVIEQLKICVSTPISESLWPMLHPIYTFLNEHVSRDGQIVEDLPEKWIYLGDQFVESSRVYREESQATVDLRPFLAVLPSELKKYDSLFAAAGVIKEVDTDVHVLLRVLNELQDPGDKIVTPKRRLHLVNNILRRLLEFDDVLEDVNVQTQLVIPTNCEPIKLLPPSNVCYGDTDWMRKGMTAEDLEVEDDEEPIYLVNDDVTPQMAERLGAVPLSKKLAGADEIGGIKQSGQYEPLTVRLKNILRDGYQPDAIPKEMVQNAEDAGASEVKFMLDLRTNDDKMTTLLDPAMKNVQGEALWVYNDAVFTDKDLENITKLGGATKSEDRSKIGQFGLGFNSVYHITDVPSFVTRKYITFFDPHKTYLKRHIRGEGSGIQLNFLSSPKRMRRFRDQLLTYNGIFGCKILGDNEKPEEFNGTVFRLPLRNEESARRGDICPQSYSEENMKPLIKSICNSAINLLLFTENVSSISVYLLENNSTEEAFLYTVKRTDITNNCFKELVHRCMSNDESLPEDVVIEMHFTSNWSKRCLEYLELEVPSYQAKEKWIKVASGGKGEAKALSTSEVGKTSGLLPCGGVAWKPNSQFAGNAFCFLPLSVPPSGLPVCINGSFAVSPDRRSLWKYADALQSASGDLKSRWNEVLCGDVIVSAYITLLQEKTVQNYGLRNKDQFFLWPNVHNTPTNGDFGKLVTSFYRIVAETRPPVFAKNDRLLSLDDVFFGDTHIQENVAMFTIFERVMQNLSGKAVIKLPAWVKQGFKEAKYISLLEERTYTWSSFYRDYVFPNYNILDYKDIKLLVLFALELRDQTILQLMETCQCLSTVSTNGIIFKQPSELKDRSVFEHIYSEEEGVFLEPSLLQLLDEYQVQTIREIGGLRKHLTSDEVLERAATVKSIWSLNEEAAVRRSNGILMYLDCNLNALEILKDDLQNALFLPAVKGNQREVIECAKNIYSNDKRHLVGEVCYILSDKSKMSPSVSLFLNICGKEVQFVDVRENVFQMHILYSTCVPNVLHEQWTCLYMYLQSHLENPEVLSFIRAEKCFLVEKAFVQSCKLSKRDDAFPPYLYQVPSSLTSFEALLKAAQVKDHFSSEDLILALQSLANDHRATLDNGMLRSVLTKIVKPLFDIAEHIPKSLVTEIPLPDTFSVLCPSRDLCFCDLDQFEHLISPSYKLLHNEIPVTYARALGVKDIREQMLSKYSHTLPGFNNTLGESFGQREDLVNRLKRIMEGYPCDFGILKELVQNADDAKATKVHFLLDYTNYPQDFLFFDSMKHLQGPALLAYNDKPFSDEDLKGIQNLGEGSKGNDMYKIGRYGVGFNIIYHLTDCPMFLSNMDTLCIFDPTLKFIKNASVANPGRMFRPVDEVMIKSYADIFSCFMSFQETLPLKNGSLFRFPLRREKSDLGGPISGSDIEHLFEMFKKEMFDVLLFLKSVEEISISICDNGKVRSTYTVTANHVSLSTLKRKQFFQGPFMDLSAGDTKTFHCETKIQDSVGNEERWLVHQRIGVENTNEIPRSLSQADSIKKLRLVPKGGVAAKISVSSKHATQYASGGKAYCFLPLPISTSLPVHVDGYFSLDHEARRNLWQGNIGDPRSDWNYLLTKEVIAPCYVLALQSFKQEISHSYQTTMNVENLRKSLQIYHSLFPSCCDHDGFTRRNALGEISVAFYQQIAREELALFPALCENAQSESPVCSNISLSWHSCMSNAQNKGFFRFNCHSEKDEKLIQLLILLGFPVLDSPLEIYKSLRIALMETDEDKEVLVVSVQYVTEFLRKDAKKTTLSGLPRKLNSTFISNVESFMLLVNYVLKGSNMLLHGLPLLLTHDGMLREFTKENPVFYSSFVDLLPSCANEFLHQQLSEILVGKSPKPYEYVRKLTVKDVLERLPTFLPEQTFSNCDYIAWDEKIPTRQWLTRFWVFLRNSENNEEYLKNVLGDWCIFPAVIKEEPFLLPLHLAKTVVSEINPSYLGNMYAVLKKLNCPFHMTICDNIGLVQQYQANFSSSIFRKEDILFVLGRHMAAHAESFGELHEKHHDEIIRYFSNGILQFSREKLQVVRRLPCFPTITGDRVSLSGIVYAISTIDVPLMDHEKWIFVDNCLLLKKDMIPRQMISALQIEDLDDKELYRKFILPFFKSFSSEARWAHIDKLIKMVRSDEYPESVVNYLDLKATPLIPTNDGTLHVASEFFDIKNPVFQIMLPNDSFPPNHPNKSKQMAWCEFLCLLGLHTNVSKHQYERFLNQVSNDEENHTRQEVLVRYLFQSHHLHDKFWLRSIVNIPFISAAKVSKEYNELHRQCDSKLVALSAVEEAHVQLVWTTLALLPSWVREESIQCYMCPNRQSIIESKLPSLEQVLSHTQTLFGALSKKDEQASQKAPVVMEYRMMLNKIIQSILEFLSKVCLKRSLSMFGTCETKMHCCTNCSLISESLKDVAIIPIDGICFKAKRLTRRLQRSENDKLFLMLKEIPDFLVPYSNLLYCLGATEEPSIQQYANALQIISKLRGNLKLNPPMFSAAEQAMNGFFTCLSKDTENEIVGLEKVFFLSNKNQLIESTNMYFSDVPAFRKRMKSFTYPVMSQKQLQDRFKLRSLKNLLMKLGQLRPKFISEHVKEVEETFAPEAVLEYCPCTEALQIGRALRFKNFGRAMKCIMINEGIRDLSMHEKIFGHTLNIYCLPHIQTYLNLEKGGPIPGSELECGVLFKSASEGEVNIYISHAADEDLIYTQIAQKYFQYFDIGIQRTTSFEAILRAESEEEMFKKLHALGLHLTDSELEESFAPPLLGSDIEKDVICLLSENFMADFYPEEYVGYNKSEGTDEHMVYAKIVRKVESEDTYNTSNWRFNVQYIIDIGEERRVSVVWLYKFPRPDDDSVFSEISPSTSAVVEIHSHEDTSDLPTRVRSKNLDQVKREISEEIEALWRMNENIRKSGLRRLMRIWHPDKHSAEDKYFAEEVFKHIRREIERLEKGVPSGLDSEDDIKNWARSQTFQENRYWRNHERRYGGSGGGGGETFTDAPGTYGRYHSRRRPRRSWRRWQSHSFYTPPSFQKVNEEALRWLKQARIDLQMVSSQAGETDRYYQWKCSLCFFASEKSVKAAQLSCGCKMSDKQSFIDAAIYLKPHLDVLLLAQRLIQIVKLRSHYPSSCSPPHIPHELYNKDHAEETMTIAQAIFDKVDNYLKGI